MREIVEPSGEDQQEQNLFKYNGFVPSFEIKSKGTLKQSTEVNFCCNPNMTKKNIGFTPC